MVDFTREEGEKTLADTIPMEEIQTVCAMTEMTKPDHFWAHQSSQILRDDRELKFQVIDDNLSTVLQVNFLFFC